MGLFDGLRDALGLGAEAAATRDADPDDLWGMSTAYVTMAAELDYVSAGAAALCFASVDSTDFADTLREVTDILAAGAAETGTEAAVQEDETGYEWVVLRDDDVEDLLTSVHFAADTFIERGYGNRLLAALFAFAEDPAAAAAGERVAADPSDPVYWVYSFRRGAFYPFAPEPDHERDSEAEFTLRSVLEGELDVETDRSYWYPLWPPAPDRHPWGEPV